MDKLCPELIIQIFKNTDEESKLKFALVSKRLFDIFKKYIASSVNFKLMINSVNFWNLFNINAFYEIPFKNISIILDKTIKLNEYLKFIKSFADSVEILEIGFFKFKNFLSCFEIFNSLKNLKSFTLTNCQIEKLNGEAVNPIKALKTISFNKCDDNIFKIFINQDSIEKITVQNNDWTWNGFPHDIFNEICKNSTNLSHMVLEGAGTGSYFDSDEFPYKISKLETTMITFHWYVGIRTQRIRFLESQKGSLKELTIHQLPFDFDGGRVLKYIIEEMKLDKFYYGKIPLILNGQKQEVKEFAASEIQITSAIEMFLQFPSTTKFTLNLSSTDVASDEIERRINPTTTLYENITEFEVNDKSTPRGTFGIFLGLYKNMRNVKKLKFNTQDRNINVILEECLPHMTRLEEIRLTSKAPRVMERFRIIRQFVPGLKIISVASQFMEDARNCFDENVQICEAEKLPTMSG
ncbi:hypothetical protein ACKWTF_015783 [Chironomus riparius]